MGITLDGVYEWNYSRLAADATIENSFPAGVHRGTIAQGFTGSALVMEFYTGSVLSVINGITVYEELVLTVKAIGEKKDWQDMVAGFHRAHELLHRQRGTGEGNVAILFCEYISPVQQPETQYGMTYENYGGRFRYTAQAQ